MTRGILVLFFISICFWILFLARKAHTETKLISIYTAKDIYHLDVNQLAVSFESRDTVLRFSSHAEMARYIETQTANDLNN